MEEKLFFKNSKGLKLCGIISYLPKNKNQSIVIICHGFASNKNRSTYKFLAKKLIKNNIASFRFDFFGHGESEGNFSQITVSEAVDNIIQSIKFLKKLGYKKFALFGSSFGGLSSIIATAKLKDINLLILRSPVSSYLEIPKYQNKQFIKKWKETGYIFYHNKKLNYSFYEDAKKNSAYKIAKKIFIPTLIVHGDKDNIVPIKQSKKLIKILPKGQLKIIKGAGHRYLENNTKEKMLNEIIEFIINNFEN